MPKIARADVIGSLLRPPYLQEARTAAREGRLSPAEARAAEDGAITEAVGLQESAGLDAVTDGEFRRMSFIATIGVRDAELGPLTGFKTLVTDAEWTALWKYPDGSFGGLTLPEDQTKARRSIVVDKVGVKRDIVAEEFPFLKAHTHKAQAKYTFPAPSWHRVAWDPKHSRDAYPTAREFLIAMRDYIRVAFRRVNIGRWRKGVLARLIYESIGPLARWRLDHDFYAFPFEVWLKRYVDRMPAQPEKPAAISFLTTSRM